MAECRVTCCLADAAGVLCAAPSMQSCIMASAVHPVPNDTSCPQKQRTVPELLQLTLALQPSQGCPHSRLALPTLPALPPSAVCQRQKLQSTSRQVTSEHEPGLCADMRHSAVL